MVLAKAQALPVSSSSSGDTDSSSSTSLNAVPPTNGKATTKPFVVGAAKPGASVTSKPVVVKAAAYVGASQPSKRVRGAAEEEDKEEPDNKKKKGQDVSKKGTGVEKHAEEVDSKRKKGGKGENGVAQRAGSKKDRKLAAEKDKQDKERVQPVKDEAGKEGLGKKAEKEKPKLEASDKEPVLQERKTGRAKKSARDGDAAKGSNLADDSPRSTPPEKPAGVETTPVKPKNPSHWSFEDEMALSAEVLAHMRPGQQVTAGRGDTWFLQLAKDLKGKLDKDWSKEQLSDKLRRMKHRYLQLDERGRDKNSVQKFKSSNEEMLFKEYWRRIWGPGEVEAVKAPAQPPSDEDDSSSEDGEEPAEEQPLSQTKPSDTKDSDGSSQDVKAKAGGSLDNSSDDEDEGHDGDETDEDSKPQSLPAIAAEEPIQHVELCHNSAMVEQDQPPALATNELGLKSSLPDVQVSAGLTSLFDGMDLDRKAARDKEHVDTIARLEAWPKDNSDVIASLESRLASVEQVQEKSLSILEHIKASQSRLVSVVEFLSTRLTGINAPALGGLGASIPRLLSGIGNVGGVISNGLHGGDSANFVKLQQQWKALDVDELGCIVRRLQLVQEQQRLQEEELKLLQCS